MEECISTLGRAFVCKIDDRVFLFESHAEREEQYRAALAHAQSLCFTLDYIAFGESRNRTPEQYRRAWLYCGDDQHIAVTMGKHGPVYHCRTDKKSFGTLAECREHIKGD